jgi:menaquinone-9 beta-reductase
MHRCDVIVVGGGPAGSTCAAALVRAGLDVVVTDKATFPRDKVCAGWITPAVASELALDFDDYRQGRTLEEIRGFRIGRMGDRIHEHSYDEPMSYGIRRCELDHYLLARSGARLALGRRADRIERRGSGWIVAGEIEGSVLVGAGGHFCPVARALGGAHDRAVVAAEEAEFEVAADEIGCDAVRAGVPELYYTPDLTGYGWLFRKGSFLNIGLGVRATNDGATPGKRPLLKQRMEELLAYLKNERRIDRAPAARLDGHAYVLGPDSRRKRFGDGFVLVGDAAGLAYDRSGEGIRCAVESGMLAARAIRDALACAATAERDLAVYGEMLARRFGAGASKADAAFALLPASLRERIASTLLSTAWFSRRVLLERWFLHVQQPELAAA